jgi:hypothetical protein
LAIDDSGEWWIGSEAGDIETYLRAYVDSEEAYPISAYHGVRCACGGERFRAQRAGDIVRRECAACGASHVVCRKPEDWEEAVDEEQPEAYACVKCGAAETNIGVGFAGYPESPDIDAVKWFYVGVRCAACGVLGCFGDGKVGWGPAVDVYEQA